MQVLKWLINHHQRLNWEAFLKYFFCFYILGSYFKLKYIYRRIVPPRKTQIWNSVRICRPADKVLPNVRLFCKSCTGGIITHYTFLTHAIFFILYNKMKASNVVFFAVLFCNQSLPSFSNRHLALTPSPSIPLSALILNTKIKMNLDLWWQHIQHT